MARFWGSLITWGEIFDPERHQAYCMYHNSGLLKEQTLVDSGKINTLDRATVDEIKHEERDWWIQHLHCPDNIIATKEQKL